MRTHLAALTAATVTGLVLPGAPVRAATHLPPVDPAAMSGSIAGLPDDHVTGAQVRVGGRAGRWEGASGVRDVRSGRPVPDGARFRIGSATKMFTAALVVQLAAEGRPRLEDTVQLWLPGVLPAAYPPITLVQLLEHTSGLPFSTEDSGHETAAWVVRHRFDWHTPRALVRSATAQPLVATPGTQQHYNGINYVLAGLVVEAVTGHSYVHELRSRLLRPLRLDDTELPGRGEVRLHGPHTHGYVRVAGGLVDVTEQSAYAWAEGGLVSSTRDLRRFLGALVSGRVVPEPWVDRMLVVPDVPYAGGGAARFCLGLERTALPGGPVVYGKSGRVPGYRTLAVATRDARRVLVLSLTTTGNGDGGEDPRLFGIAAAAFGITG